MSRESRQAARSRRRARRAAERAAAREAARHGGTSTAHPLGDPRGGEDRRTVERREPAPDARTLEERMRAAGIGVDRRSGRDRRSGGDRRR